MLAITYVINKSQSSTNTDACSHWSLSTSRWWRSSVSRLPTFRHTHHTRHTTLPSVTGLSPKALLGLVERNLTWLRTWNRNSQQDRKLRTTRTSHWRPSVVCITILVVKTSGSQKASLQAVGTTHLPCAGPCTASLRARRSPLANCWKLFISVCICEYSACDILDVLESASDPSPVSDECMSTRKNQIHLPSTAKQQCGFTNTTVYSSCDTSARKTHRETGLFGSIMTPVHGIV